MSSMMSSPPAPSTSKRDAPLLEPLLVDVITSLRQDEKIAKDWAKKLKAAWILSVADAAKILAVLRAEKKSGQVSPTNAWTTQRDRRAQGPRAATTSGTRSSRRSVLVPTSCADGC